MARREKLPKCRARLQSGDRLGELCGAEAAYSTHGISVCGHHTTWNPDAQQETSYPRTSQSSHDLAAEIADPFTPTTTSHLSSVETDNSGVQRTPTGKKELQTETLWLSMRVPSYAAPEIRGKAKELNARMEKKGLSGRVSVKFGSPIIWHDEPPLVECSVFESGDWKVGEWSVVGVYSFAAGEDTPLRWGFPEGYPHPETVDRMRCDHCGKRRNRTTCVVLSDDDGEEMVVGKTCLKDFTGHSPGQVLRIRDEMENLRDWMGSGAYSMNVIATEDYLAAAVAATRKYGFKRSHEDDNTKEQALVLLVSRKEDGSSLVTDADREKAQEIREWAEELEASSSFDENMKIVGMSEEISKRAYGIAAYMPTAYAEHEARKIAREERAKAQAERDTSRRPIPDDFKGEIRGTVVKIVEQEDLFKPSWNGCPTYTWKVTVVSDEGYTVWGTLPASANEAQVGDRVEFTVSSIEKSEKDETFGFFKRPRKWNKLGFISESGVFVVVAVCLCW